ncbi:hypothetical protein ACK325_02565 [Aeromonas hydrophila]|uniref:hypothetical protein n=1 Tax=Aeromonas hydrophila TaxID=644 RepID=UPI003988DA6E
MKQVEYRIDYSDVDFEVLVKEDEIQNYLRLPDSDFEIPILRESAIRMAERYMNRPLTKQSGSVYANVHEFRIPYTPITGDITIKSITDSSGKPVTGYTWDRVTNKIKLDRLVQLPVTLEIDFIKEDVPLPAAIKLAILKICATEYELREDSVVAASVTEIPNTAAKILDLYSLPAGGVY